MIYETQSTGSSFVLENIQPAENRTWLRWIVATFAADGRLLRYVGVGFNGRKYEEIGALNVEMLQTLGYRHVETKKRFPGIRGA